MDISSYIDSTKLGFTVTSDEIKKMCVEAKENHFASVCVPPCFVKLAHQELCDSSVAVCTVVGFPFGNNTTKVKVTETKEALKNGATEIDMVMNIGALKERSYDYIIEEITEVRDECKGNILKVIVETSVLTEDEIREATKICNLTFVNFIKTSTGYGTRGASIKDIDIMVEEKNEVLEIKASGGISSVEEAVVMLEHGATRIGTSKATDIVKGGK